MPIERPYTWHLGTVTLHGLAVEVWQRCAEDRRFRLEQPDHRVQARLISAEGRVARLHGFYHVQAPADVRRVLVVAEITPSVVGVTLRLPDLDIDISDSVALSTP